MMEEYKKVVNTSDGDAVKGDDAGRQATGKEGRNGLVVSSVVVPVSPPSVRFMT